MSYDQTSFAITYSVNNLTYSLDGLDSTSGLTFNFLGGTGFGLPPIARITKRGMLQQGDSNVDYRVDARLFTLTLLIEANNYVDHMRIREKLGNIFRISNTPAILTLTYTTTVSSVTTTYARSISCFVAGGLSFDSVDQRDYNVLATISLRATDPMWYETTPTTFSISQLLSGTPTPIPFLIPTTFGGISLSQITDLQYTGSAIEYPVISIVTGTANITNVYILNASTNKLIFFPILYANRTYTIDLRYGYKTITDDTGFNCIGLLGMGSTLMTWGLDPNQPNGINSLSVSSDVATATSSITLTYYNRYAAI